MKVLRKKLKKASKIMKFFYFIFLLAYFIGYGFFCYSILQLQGIETVIRILLMVGFAIFGLLFLIFGLTSVIQHKKKVFIPYCIFAVIFTICFGVSSYYINRIYNVLDQFTGKETSTYKTVLLALNGHELNSDSSIGMIDNESNRENYILAKEMIEQKQIKNKIVYYDDINVLVAALYNGEVEAIFISKDYPVLFSNDEKYATIASETTVLDSYSKEMKTEESEMVTTKSLTEPFSILILGVDSESTEAMDANAAFNGDTLMLITFNPQTLNATVFSIPRDLYVPITCNNNRYNKVNSSAYGGTSCVINTVEKLTDIDIDYFVKVDFKAVVDLVEALGGVDVDVEPPDYKPFINQYNGRLCEQNSLRQFGEHLICMDTGLQHLNGEQALAYARNRHGYKESDIARTRHQQQVIEAMAKKLLHNSSFSDFEKLLDTVSKHIATNMKTTQILSFYQTIKSMLGNALKGEDFITIQKTYLTYYNLTVPIGGYQASALGYYQGSMDAITKAMKENLGLVKVETIKTFSYDFNEDAERSSDVIGKGIYTGSKLSFMPSFVGSSISNAKAFALENDLSIYIEYESDETQIPGIILRQSVVAGTMVNNISGFTIYVNKIDSSSSKNTTDKDLDSENKTDKNDNTSNSNKNDSSNNSSSSNKSDDNSTNKENNNSNTQQNSSGNNNSNSNSSSNTEDNGSNKTDNNSKEDENKKDDSSSSKSENSNDTASTIPGNPATDELE